MFWPNFLLLLCVVVCGCVWLCVVVCCCVLLCVVVLVPVGACWCLLVPVGACWCLLVLVRVQDFWASTQTPPPDRPFPGPPKISLFFFSLPQKISFFLLSLGGLLVEFWCWPWKSADDGRNRVGPSSHHDSPRTPNVHISGPRRFKTPPKFHEKTPREGRKERNFGRSREGRSWEGRAVPNMTKPKP